MAEPKEISAIEYFNNQFNPAQINKYSSIASNTTKTHTGLVDENKKLLTMMVTVKELPHSSYLFKQSTEVVLLRPPTWNMNRGLSIIGSATGK